MLYTLEIRNGNDLRRPLLDAGILASQHAPSVHAYWLAPGRPYAGVRLRRTRLTAAWTGYEYAFELSGLNVLALTDPQQFVRAFTWVPLGSRNFRRDARRAMI